VVSLWGGGGPPRWHHPGKGLHHDESLKNAAEFTKNTTEMITWKAERVGVVTMTKKGHHFFKEKMG